MSEAASEKIQVYYLESEAGIFSVERLKKELLQLLESPGKIILNLSRLESLDLPVLQVLLAFYREAAARNIQVGLSGATSRAVLESVSVCGLSKSVVSNTKQLETLLSGAARQEEV